MPDDRRWHYVEMVVAASLLIFAAAAIVFIIPNQILAPRTVFGVSTSSTSPATVPYVLCTLIFFCSAAYLGRVVRRPRPERSEHIEETPASVRWRAPAIVALGVAYTLAFENVPFIVSTPIFLICSYFVLDQFPPRLSLLRLVLLVGGAVGFALLLKTIFEQGFRIYLGG